ncbi:MAG: glycosyltransferase family 39 protein [bacterium]|nr:glycosyltransferase family 39 protein [bacterium]
MFQSINTSVERSLIGLLLVAGLALRVYFLIATPYHEPARIGALSAYNDEPAHVAYTLHILETGKLPSAGEPITRSLTAVRPTFENFQSPLYYMIHSGVCRSIKATTERDVMLTGRVLSLLCMVGIVWTAHTITRQLRTNGGNWIVMLTVLTLSGVFVRFSTQSGNEAMAWLLSGLVMLTVLRLDERANARPLYAMAILFVLGVYTKLSLLILLPVIALAIYESGKALPRVAWMATVFILIGVSPLMIYNIAVFGSAIPLAIGFGAPIWRWPTFDTVLYLVRSSLFPWSELWRSWIGVLLMSPALICISWLTVRAMVRRTASWSLALLLSAAAAYLWLNLRYDQAEGRYLFVAWPAAVPVLASTQINAPVVFMTVAVFTLPYLLFVI